MERNFLGRTASRVSRVYSALSQKERRLRIDTPDRVARVLRKDESLADLRTALYDTRTIGDSEFNEFLLRTQIVKVAPQFIQFVDSVKSFLPSSIQLPKGNETTTAVVKSPIISPNELEITRIGRSYYFIPEDSRVIEIPDLALQWFTESEILSGKGGVQIGALVKLVGEEALDSKDGRMSLNSRHQLERHAWPGMFELVLSKIDESIEGKDIPDESKDLRQKLIEKFNEYYQQLAEKEEELGSQVKVRFWDYLEGLARNFRLPKKVIVPYGTQAGEEPVVRLNLEKQNNRFVVLPAEQKIMEVPIEKGKFMYDKAIQTGGNVYLHLGNRIQRSLEQAI